VNQDQRDYLEISRESVLTVFFFVAAVGLVLDEEI